MSVSNLPHHHKSVYCSSIPCLTDTLRSVSFRRYFPYFYAPLASDLITFPPDTVGEPFRESKFCHFNHVELPLAQFSIGL